MEWPGQLRQVSRKDDSLLWIEFQYGMFEEQHISESTEEKETHTLQQVGHVFPSIT